jgi:hypothetical protein
MAQQEDPIEIVAEQSNLSPKRGSSIPRSRALVPAAERWHAEAHRHYARLSLPMQPKAFSHRCSNECGPAWTRLRAAARDATLPVDDELRIAPLAAEERSLTRSKHFEPNSIAGSGSWSAPKLR